ncbi:DUF4232 domain-containing protein [Streptomyces sp. NPDC051636]|uniref:DUF4232 domain-containing protein n=1 Tax=Streptomyces sp. NPDC051636 TaxID=3365663 RepID=UPI0037B61EB3
MAYTSQSLHRAAVLGSAVAVLGLLSACGGDTGSGAPQKVPGNASPASDVSDVSADSGSTTAVAPSGAPSGSSAPSGTSASTKPAGRASAGGDTATTNATSTRCHTSELRAAVGRNNPGAGQENFPIVLTNKSVRTCTLHGYPGAAFVNASGSRLGPDPKRSPGKPATVTLRPGQSAWAGLSFSNPEVSGAKTATPAALLVTPPDERDQLKVKWTAGPVPVSGNSSSVFLTVFSPGTGA